MAVLLINDAYLEGAKIQMLRTSIVLLFLVSTAIVISASDSTPGLAINSTAPIDMKVYVLGLTYNEKQLNPEYIFVGRTMFFDIQENGPFTLKLVSSNNKVIYNKRFNISTGESELPQKDWFDKNLKQIVIPTVKKTKSIGFIELLVPFSPNAKFIQIEQNKKIMLTVPVYYFTTNNSQRTLATPNASPQIVQTTRGIEKGFDAIGSILGHLVRIKLN